MRLRIILAVIISGVVLTVTLYANSTIVITEAEDISLVDPYGMLQAVDPNNGNSKLNEIAGFKCWANTNLFEARVAIKFDLSEIPANFTVSDAKLKMYKYGNFSGFKKPGVYCVYKLTKEWDEGSANWDRSSSSEKWNKPGGDFEPAAIDSFHYNGSYNGWFTYDVIPMVIDIVTNPDKNFGFIIRTPDKYANQNISMDQGSYFHSTEATIDSLTPRLIITDMTTGIVTARENQPGLLAKCLNNRLSLCFPVKPKGKLNVSVMNFNGRMLYEGCFVAVNTWIHIPRNFTPGSYCLSIKSRGLNQSKKVIIY